MHVFHLCMVMDVMKRVIVHHVIISTAVMSHWKKQVIKRNKIDKNKHE